jgi:ATP-binding cassette subfamily B protein
MIQPFLNLAGTLGRAMRLVWQSGHRLALAHGSLAATLSLLPLAGLYMLKRAVDAAGVAMKWLNAVPGVNEPMLGWLDRSTAFREVAFWLVAGAIVMGLSAVVRLLLTWVAELHALAVGDRVHALLHAKMLSVDLEFFENTDGQNRLHLAREQALSRPVRVLAGLSQLLQGVVGFGGVLIILWGFDPRLPPILVAAAIPAVLFRVHRTRRLYEWRRDLAPLERESGYFHELLSGSGSAKEVRLYGHGPFCQERFQAVRARLRAERLTWRRFVVSRELIVQAVSLIVVAGVLLWMTRRLFDSVITIGALVMYAQAVQRGQGFMSTFVGAAISLYEDSLFLQGFEELMDQPCRIQAPPAPRPIPRPIRDGIVFEGVGFTYPGTTEPVLQDVSFAIRPGERVAVAGANGAGKTTLVKLLCRLYDPTSGRILIDGVDLREVDPAAWRARIGVVFQDFEHYQFTAAENVWIGDPHGSADDPRVAAAAQRAGLTEAVAAWPQGLHTQLGRWLREGVEPSVGQWQRVALARAFVRDPDVLVLDEPTSALDPQAQRDVLEKLRELSAGRLALIVSHRLPAVDLADRVVVLREGRVSEQGAPADLLAQGGELARLFGS